uniref:EF-hand domain-containing protein n=1 Tax=Timspurckia oligopyrenoides TaxID=708627 RepID=A0A7S0ZCW8_9RHOD|mmetsp:Transcript_12908/g.23203  ORF Transcript_12908/g.23203 Transcript_12908/m.23203 type:complete len:162 (+) Transcript_12908:93-578(+)|eukprot:CAMPEP_0182448280 /NCGR_PEP_ID=MMETSP1172-20130603/25659_1 /TAXON_ID=708627 /ORGANISM="Timspurckia oligopyrenoides, Strain CCMP3278" /LENGTH=161 /DNA_ID=CAMNT_0024645083 /DNA_START=47 /DNA_END=532 /DNA_ORIENTATION=+
MEGEALRNFELAFRAFDPDSSGTIDKTELAVVLRALGDDVQESEVEEIIKEFDTDGKGALTFSELLTLIIRRYDDDRFKVSVEDTFRIFDRDGSGGVSKKELHDVFKNIGADITWEETEVMLEEADTNKDGEVDFEEFLQIYAKVEAKSQKAAARTSETKD